MAWIIFLPATEKEKFWLIKIVEISYYRKLRNIDMLEILELSSVEENLFRDALASFLYTFQANNTYLNSYEVEFCNFQLLFFTNQFNICRWIQIC